MSNLQTSKYEAAWKIVQDGNPAIPIVPGTKVPPKGFKLVEFWTRLPTDVELKQWFLKDNLDLAMVTGNKRLVVDVDFPNGDSSLKTLGGLPLTYQVKTRNDGRHYHFAGTPEELKKIPSRNGIRPGVDVKCSGGYVLMPPTIGYEDVTAPSCLAPLVCIDKYPISSLLLFSSTNISISNCKASANTKEPVGLSSLSSNVVNVVTLDWTEGSRDQSIYHVAVCLKRGGMDIDGASKVIEIIAKNCSPPFTTKDALEKIKSAFEHGTPSDRQIAADIREWVSSSFGVISSSEFVKYASLSSTSSKKNVSKVFSRLVEEKIIERVGDRNGYFRKIDRDCEEMEWWSASSKATFDLEWPFGLEKLVRLYPKNIVVVAGAVQAGKTAFLLNTAIKNIPKYAGRIHYFNSETGEDELSGRIEDFGLPMENWRNIKFKFRSSNFSDVIEPDDINIIDYLEVLDNFYLVGKMIKEIFDKLRSGIAIIALQKKDGSDLGRGAEFGLEKPRLYLSLGNGKLKIMKAKNWAQKGKNPNGMEFCFKLAGGCRFVDVSSNSLVEVEF